MRTRKPNRKFFSLDPTIQKFFEDHGPCVYIGHEAFFADGAAALRCSTGWESLEAPEDRDKRSVALAIHHYWKQTAEEAERVFNEYQSVLENQQIVYDEEENLEKLGKLRDKAASCSQEAERGRAEVEAVTPKRELQRPKLQAANRQQAEEFKRKVRNLKL